MEEHVLEAEPRSETGSRAARIYRSEGRLPANVYGHKEANLHVTLDTKEFTRFLDAGHRVATLRVGGKDEHGVVREVQYDSLGSHVVHVDFARVGRDEKIEVEVPIETVGVPKGVASGGLLEQPLKSILVRGLATNVPEHIELRVEDFEIGTDVRVRDLPVPANCELVHDEEDLVLHVVARRGTEAAAPEGEEAPSQPEVIGRKKEDEGDAQ